MKQKAAKEKQFKPDIDMLVHKYSDYYEDFVNYDAREIVYPVYKTKVEYIISKEQELHPIVIGILKIIDYLQKIKIDDIIEAGFETLVKEKSQVKILVSPK